MIRKIIKKVIGKKGTPGRETPAAPSARAPEGAKEAPARRKKSAERRTKGRKRPQGKGSGRSAVKGGRPWVARKLPELPPMPAWHPPDDPGRFERYGLPASVMEGIAAAGFIECTEVQERVLPLSLHGKDVAAQSQTGTGKTAAFLITIFSRLLWRGRVKHEGPRALVLAPTRELTVQIEDDARLLGAKTGFRIGVAFGGVDYERQRTILKEGVDLLIGTPGRLIDYMKQGVWKTEGIEILVIDEADRMLDMGFIKDLRYILRRLPPYERRLSMLFSATLSWRAMELTYEYMNLPEQISASPDQVTAERAEEVLYHVGRDEKAALLLGLLRRESWERVIIFANMKIEAEKLGRLIAHHGYRAQAITGNLDQKRRLRLMGDFKSGKLPILVATDVASRGLHIESVSHVLNWDLPQDPEDYVHRIGRTARAGEAGKAISLADEKGAYNLEAIEKLIGYKIPVIWHTSEELEDVRGGWEKSRPRKRGPGRGGQGRPKKGGGTRRSGHRRGQSRREGGSR